MGKPALDVVGLGRPLSSPKVGEIAVSFAFAALDVGASPQAVLDAWTAIGAAMPLALGLAENALARRAPVPADFGDQIRELMTDERERAQRVRK